MQPKQRKFNGHSSVVQQTWTRRRMFSNLGGLFLGGFLAGRGIATAHGASTVGQPTSIKRFTKAGGGAGDGSSWQDAMPLDLLGKSIALAEPGSGFLIGFSPDDDPVALEETKIRIRSSGSVDGPIYVGVGLIGSDGGISPASDGRSVAFFKSAREWSVGIFAKNVGIPCYLAIEKGASFLDLAGFQIDGTTGDGFLKFRGGKDGPTSFTNIRISGINAQNVGRVIETDKNAALADLIVENCKAFGVVRGFARFHKLSNSVLRNLELDSAGLDGGRRDICQLVAITAGDNVTFENVTLKNALNAQIKSDGKQGYVQGDGIVCERGTSNVVIRNCHGSGMGDGVFDLKTTNVTIEDSSAENCKFGARIWTESNNVIRRCDFRNPVTRGKNHGACIQASGTLDVVDSKLQAGPGQAAFSLNRLKKGNPPVVRVIGGSIQLDGDAKLARPAEGAVLDLQNVSINGEPRTERLVFDKKDDEEKDAD